MYPHRSNDPFPHCNDTIVGDKNLNEKSLFSGLWYKPYAWKPGEPIEYSPCNSVDFSVSSSGQLTMVTNWTAKDGKDVPWPMTCKTEMSPKPQVPGTYLNVGSTYGLSVSEYHNFAYDGTGEEEPFVVDYVCGSSLQGPYTTAFVLTKTPEVSPKLERRFATMVTQSLGLEWNTFVAVDNSCFKPSDVVV